MRQTWERIKEQGFALASVGVAAADLAVFIIIAVRGVATLWEPTPWILTLEIALNVLYLVWAVERFLKDWLGEAKP